MACSQSPVLFVASLLVALMDPCVKLGIIALQLCVNNDSDIHEHPWSLNDEWRNMLLPTLYQEDVIGIAADEVPMC